MNTLDYGDGLKNIAMPDTAISGLSHKSRTTKLPRVGNVRRGAIGRHENYTSIVDAAEEKNLPFRVTGQIFGAISAFAISVWPINKAAFVPQSTKAKLKN